MYPSISLISNDSDLSERQVYRCIKTLEKSGYIRIKRNRGGRNIYQLLKSHPAPEDQKRDHPTPAKTAPLTDSHPPLTGSHPTPDTQSPELYIRTKSNNNTLSISEDQLSKIAEDYQVPESFVRSKLDDLTNYCAFRGKVYKDYYAALRHWVKADAMKLKQKGGSNERISFINPK